MKRASVSIAGWLLSAALLQAGAESIIKQRAKDLRDQNNARQGVPAPNRAAPAQATTPPAQAPAPVALTSQQHALGRLQSDLVGLRPGAQLTESKKQQLTRNLSAVAQGKKPSPQLTTQLADDVTEALSQKLLTTQTRTRLLQNLSATMNADKFATGQLERTVSDIQSLLKSSGVSEQQARKVGDSARAVILDIRKPAK